MCGKYVAARNDAANLARVAATGDGEAAQRIEIGQRVLDRRLGCGLDDRIRFGLGDGLDDDRLRRLVDDIGNDGRTRRAEAERGDQQSSDLDGHPSRPVGRRVLVHSGTIRCR